MLCSGLPRLRFTRSRTISASAGALLLAALVTTSGNAQQHSTAPAPRRMRDAMAQPMGDGPTIRLSWNSPQFLVADSSLVCVIDYGDVDVVCLSWQDNVVQKVGRRGQGPGEYEDARRIQLLRDGILLHDADLRRAILFSRNGAYRKQWPQHHAFGVLFMDDRGDLWGVPLFGKEFLWRLDADGKVTERIPRPPSLRTADVIALQFSVQRLDSTTVLLASRTNGHFYAFDLRERRVTDTPSLVRTESAPAVAASIRLPDGTTANGWRPSPRMTYTNLSVALTKGHLLAVAGTAKPHPTRLVDVYDARSLTYQCSFTLPEQIRGMTIDRDGHLLVLFWEPEPRIARYGLAWDRCK